MVISACRVIHILNVIYTILFTGRKFSCLNRFFLHKRSVQTYIHTYIHITSKFAIKSNANKWKSNSDKIFANRSDNGAYCTYDMYIIFICVLIQQ